MRLNQFIAQASGLSRRAADKAISNGQISVNNQPATIGQQLNKEDIVKLDGRRLSLPAVTTTIILNKPVGYVCSRNGQGNPTIYELVPAKYQGLKPIGRLDKDSSGLILLTNDGLLSHELTHPKFAKEKIYEIELDKTLSSMDKAKIEQGIELEDGPSKFEVKSLTLTIGDKNSNAQHQPSKIYQVKMAEGRNRQIRRTFAALDYNVVKLNRVKFGSYKLANLKPGEHRAV